MRRGLFISLVLTALTGCGGPEGDRARVGAASLQIDPPSGRQYDGGLLGADGSVSPAQQLYLLLIMQEQIRTAGSSPDPLPGYVSPEGSSPDPLPGLCNEAGDCIPRPAD